MADFVGLWENRQAGGPGEQGEEDFLRAGRLGTFRRSLAAVGHDSGGPALPSRLPRPGLGLTEGTRGRFSLSAPGCFFVSLVAFEN